MPKPRITIVGLGRIGGSIGLALQKANADLEIVGHDKDSRAAGQAAKRGAVDKTEWNLLNACTGAGLIVLALPLGAIRDTLAVLARELPAGVIVTDTASTKASVLEWARILPRDVHFVGGDPVIPPSRVDDAGAKGIEAADAALFQNAVYCLTPSLTASAEAVNTMVAFVGLLGARPLFLDAAEHDGLITGAQHLAYILSATLLQATTASGGWRDLAKLAGYDYLHATALASRDPEAQRDIMLHHKEDLTRWIDASIETLKELKAAIVRGDADQLDSLFKSMVEAREAWLAGQVGAQPIAMETGALSDATMRMFLGGLVPSGGKKKQNVRHKE
jgi:prephenate dehydrogenase